MENAWSRGGRSFGDRYMTRKRSNPCTRRGKQTCPEIRCSNKMGEACTRERRLFPVTCSCLFYQTCSTGSAIFPLRGASTCHLFSTCPTFAIIPGILSEMDTKPCTRQKMLISGSTLISKSCGILVHVSKTGFPGSCNVHLLSDVCEDATDS